MFIASSPPPKSAAKLPKAKGKRPLRYSRRDTTVLNCCCYFFPGHCRFCFPSARSRAGQGQGPDGPDTGAMQHSYISITVLTNLIFISCPQPSS